MTASRVCVELLYLCHLCYLGDSDGPQLEDVDIQFHASNVKYMKVLHGTGEGRESYYMPQIERNAYKVVGHYNDVKIGREVYGQVRFAETLKNREPICVHDCKDTEVYLRGEDFCKIFGSKRADGKHKNSMPVVKVSHNGKSILRKYCCCRECDDIKDFVGLTYESLLLLSYDTNDINNMGKLTLSPGSRVWFYLRYSDLGERVGIWAFFISILSFILAFAGMFIG